MFSDRYLYPISLCVRCLCIGEGPVLRPLRDLRSVPKAHKSREQIENYGRACTQVLFLHKAELGFFSLFRNSDRLARTFRWSEDPRIAWLVPSTAEDPACRFLQIGKRPENTKEKSRQCFTSANCLQLFVSWSHQFCF